MQKKKKKEEERKKKKKKLAHIYPCGKLAQRRIPVLSPLHPFIPLQVDMNDPAPSRLLLDLPVYPEKVFLN
jgi:hypothetical protein